MTDRFISQLPADSNGANVNRLDISVVHRGGVDYKAVFDGALFVPASTAADANKVLTVNSTGVPAWASPARNSVYQTIWTGNVRTTNGGSDTISIDANRSLADYDMIGVIYNYNTRTPAGTPSALLNNTFIAPFGVLATNAPLTLIQEASITFCTIRVGPDNTSSITFRGGRTDTSIIPHSNNYPEITEVFGFSFGS